MKNKEKRKGNKRRGLSWGLFKCFVLLGELIVRWIVDVAVSALVNCASVVGSVASIVVLYKSDSINSFQPTELTTSSTW